LLVKEGLRIIKEMSYPFVVVLGHDKYYPRFGFERASMFGLKCQWEGVPDEAFMTIFFNGSVMKNKIGIIKYRNEFNEAV
jgi:predicted N-acetyltransferase YhbS